MLQKNELHKRKSTLNTSSECYHFVHTVVLAKHSSSTLDEQVDHTGQEALQRYVTLQIAIWSTNPLLWSCL